VSSVRQATYDRATTADTPVGVLAIAAMLLVAALAAAVSVDVVHAGYGVKGDEATYVGIALSAAYDGNLSYERRDLERFTGLYEQGPEGIFLKRGKRVSLVFGGGAPYVHFVRSPEVRQDRAYFSKAMLYSIAVAPFVRLFGMNGFLIFHVLLMFIVGVCGYLFLAAHGRPEPALAFTLAFIGASVTPVYMVFLTPDVFNFALVFVAYFFWLYKEVGAPRAPWLRGLGSDLIAAALLGAATYSKSWNAPLVLPLVLWFWWRRQWGRGFVVGAVSVVACAILFAGTFAVTGEVNYQGGDRRQFYTGGPTSGFLYDSADGTWERRGQATGRDEADVDNVFQPSEIVRLFPANVEYFLLGRHFGFVPYFFPGALAILAWLASRDRLVPWRLFTFLAVVIAVVVSLVTVPYTWSGGGGPPGNRYFLSLYPALFFLMPASASIVPALIAWIGGSLFVAKMVLNPFVAAKFPWESPERGFARKLPVELRMANDLPVRLAQPLRAPVEYRRDPLLKLYFLDRHAWPPEEAGTNPDGSTRHAMWISGGGRADIIVRCANPVYHFAVTVESPIPTVFTVSAGAAEKTITLQPSTRVEFLLPADGIRDVRSYAYLVSARSSEGFIPRLMEPGNTDARNLGASMTLQAITTPSPGTR